MLPGCLRDLCTLTLASPYTPYTMLKLVELMNKVYPPGVVSVIGGSDKYVFAIGTPDHY